jgi:hypothetical protein
MTRGASAVRGVPLRVLEGQGAIARRGRRGGRDGVRHPGMPGAPLTPPLRSAPPAAGWVRGRREFRRRGDFEKGVIRADEKDTPRVLPLLRRSRA